MNLQRLRRNWNDLAVRDALWAILTDSSKASRQWEISEFMATGTAEIQTVLNHLHSLGLNVDFNGPALDFGCGVGRLTQTLARNFPYCIGLDISEVMIDKASSLNLYPHCRYIAHSETRLPFPSESFSFIYCNIVLQHIPRPCSERTLKEFVRLLKPGGILVFGVQDSFQAPNLKTLLVRIRQLARPRSRIDALLGLSKGDMQMHCLPEHRIRLALASLHIVDIQYTNIAEKDFNGHLKYFTQAQTSGFVSKQYSVIKPM